MTKLLCIGTTLLLLFSMCSSQEKERFFDFKEIRDSTEKNTADFNPSFFASYHFSLPYRIDSFKVSYDTSSSVKIVLGGGEVVRSKGTLEVRFLDAAGDVLKKYRMASPLYQRVETGKGRALYTVKNGSFRVPVPGDSSFVRNVVWVTITDKGVVKSKTYVKTLFQNY